MVSIKFLSNLEYQTKAIDATTGLFEGALASPHERNDMGIVSNQVLVSLDILNKNLEKVQKANNLPASKVASLEGEGLYDRPNFNVEMETGTGKTYIFLRSIFELNKRYALKKFVIVVPSVAIREGVLANLRITKDHFQKLYDRAPYNFRVFSSSKFTDLSAFCRSNTLEIMVITIQSFNKEEINTLYDKGRDDVLIADSGMEMMAQTHPVIILDEPHKMGSELSQSALNNLNPLFILRYSATHTDKSRSNLIYSLGPAEAFRMGLVKKIDVIGTYVKNESSLPSISLQEVVLKPKIRAKLELKVKTEKGVVEKSVLLSQGDSLAAKAKNPAYKDLVVLNISGEDGKQHIELSGGIKIGINQPHGETYFEVAKEQIENTIATHFEKQEKLRQHGIKVLSLFFIDDVSDYQELDASKEGGAEEIARIDSRKYLFVKKAFDETFNRLKAGKSEWQDKEPADVRGAYFSSKKTFKSIAKDEEKIDEILRDKEKLLAFESPTAFIFSHSALGEGWDNPNVFNICTLRTTYKEITKRQTIGRGLRIPVNQRGERFESSPENILTVIANESYDEFAKGLQDDYVEDGMVEKPQIKNRREKVVAKLRKNVFHGEFREIWNRLRVKTGFRTEIHSEELISSCATAIRENLIVETPRLISRRAEILVTEDGFAVGGEKPGNPVKELKLDYAVPDVVTRVANDTRLTRMTIARILRESGRLKEIFNNPEEFISGVSTIIKTERVKMEVKTAKYAKKGDKYPDELFEDEVPSYRTNVLESKNSVYDKVTCDNSSERSFA